MDGLAGDTGQDMRLEHPAASREPAVPEVAAVGHERPGRCEGATKFGQRMVRDVVQDEVVALAIPGEVVGRVVDDVVGTDGADHLEIPRAADAGHLRPERLGDLDRERADAAGRPVDEDPLAGLHAAVVAQGLERDHRGHRNRGGLLERDVRGLGRQRVLGGGRELRVGAA